MLVKIRIGSMSGALARGRIAATALFTSILLVPQAGQGSVPPDYSRLASQAFDEADAPYSRRARRDMIAIPAGSYPMGRGDGPRAERPAHRVRLRGYRIDRTEVTNAAFTEYLNALNLDSQLDFSPGGLRAPASGSAVLDLLREGREGGGLYPIIALDDDQARIGYRAGRFLSVPGHEDHPVTETTWAGARAYCAWRGARLPTEAEWEAAARGEAGLAYPWGASPPDQTRVFISGRTGVTGPVGARPGASPFGVLDMSGSLAEWTSTLQSPYPYDPSDGREAPHAPGERVTRGGDYLYDADAKALTATHRTGFSNAPERGHRHIGFRCAASGPAS